MQKQFRLYALDQYAALLDDSVLFKYVFFVSLFTFSPSVLYMKSLCQWQCHISYYFMIPLCIGSEEFKTVIEEDWHIQSSSNDSQSHVSRTVQSNMKNTQ